MEQRGESASSRLRGLRIVFFGIGGVFSRAPLAALLGAGVDLRMVVAPAQAGLSLRSSGERPSAFTLLEPPPRPMTRRALPIAGLAGMTPPPLSMRDLAAQASAPLMSVARLSDPQTLAALAACAPDAICVACFTQRLPDAVLALPRLGCLNAHPSLLPDNRGPDPLFWTFHEGANETGVTIHLMDAGYDSGPILTQAHVALAAGESEAALEARLATLAGEQLVAALEGLVYGALIPTPQDGSRASSHPWPEAADYTIPADWPARRAYAFACGVFARGEPITLIARDGARFRLIEPLAVHPDATLATPWTLDGDRLTLACAPGVFVCRAERLAELD